ncbi:MAG: hypothetical protein ABL308_03420 [Oceanicaulis sp.]
MAQMACLDKAFRVSQPRHEGKKKALPVGPEALDFFIRGWTTFY